MIGADAMVPPLKVLGIAHEEGDLVLSMEGALPKEVIEYGTATFEETIDWSGSSGEVTLVDIPGESYHIADDLEPKWEGFVQAGEPIQTGLKVTASADLEWMPTYSVSITFDKDIGNGINSFLLEQSSELETNISLQAEGTYNWTEEIREMNILAPKNHLFRLKIGPVLIPVELTRSGTFRSYPKAKIYGLASSQLSSVSQIHENIAYDSNTDTGLARDISLSNETVTSLSNSSFQGDFYYRLQSSISVNILQEVNYNSGWKFHNLVGSVLKEGSELKDVGSNQTNFISTVKNSNLEIYSLGGVKYSSTQPPVFYGNFTVPSNSSSGLENPCNKENCGAGYKFFMCNLASFMLGACATICQSNLLCYLVCGLVLYVPSAALCFWCGLPKNDTDPPELASLLTSDAPIVTVRQAYDSGQIEWDVEKVMELSGASDQQVNEAISQFLQERGDVAITDLPSLILQDMYDLLDQLQDPEMVNLMNFFIDRMNDFLS